MAVEITKPPQHAMCKDTCPLKSKSSPLTSNLRRSSPGSGRCRALNKFDILHFDLDDDIKAWTSRHAEPPSPQLGTTSFQSDLHFLRPLQSSFPNGNCKRATICCTSPRKKKAPSQNGKRTDQEETRKNIAKHAETKKDNKLKKNGKEIEMK